MGNTKCLALLLTMPLCAIAACSNNFAVPSGGPESGEIRVSEQNKTTITLQTLQSDKSTPAYKIEEKLVNDYMASHPRVKIEFDRLNTEQQKSKLKTQAAFGEMADITMVNPGAQMKPYVDGGMLAPLNDMLDEKLKATFQSGVLNYYTFDGKLYALPYNLNIAGVFYNKELFAQAGLTPPGTFEGLLEAVEQFRGQGITPMVIGAKDRWPTSFLFMAIVQRLNGGPGFLQDVIDRKRRFDDPVFVEAIAKLEELIRANAFQEGAVSTDSTTASALFRNGQAAMYYTGTWEVPKIEVSPIKDNIGFFKFPTVDGKGDLNDFMIAPGTAYTISAGSKHIKECKDFLKYFMTNYPKVAVAMNSAVGLSQKVDGDFQAAGYSVLQTEMIGMFKDIKGGDMNFDNVIVPAVTQTHLDRLQNLFVQPARPLDVAIEHQLSWEASTKEARR
ncbi:extracellular solute-binding protein [Paenibacillus hamazuiensis]|uniref:extracellular solute-binding protein n=1 Tax=Paenibacillus hamazuiensis TaxID=2936508 RepID=UPI00201010FD|nr:extracellular solute-binding protein [Paenibacillus hamazuiensis]